MKPRYEKECIQLGKLAERQLNLPKNVVKQNFEDMSIILIVLKIQEEFDELKEELLNKRVINYERVYSEAGDLSGCIVGLISKINRIREEHHDDGAWNSHKIGNKK